MTQQREQYEPHQDQPSHQDQHSHQQHDHSGGHGHHGSQQGHQHNDGLADLLDLDAAVVGGYLDDVTGWVAEHAPDLVGTILDIGAGTGTGSLALARRFEGASVVAIDQSDVMIGRVRSAAERHGLGDRVRTVQADLNVSWPAVGTADVAWAASSLHEITDPDRTFRDIYGALSPGGLLVAIEMDTLPRFLPDDIGRGRPGLEARCHEALANKGWNAHPDWRPHMERAGFEVTDHHRFSIEVDPAPPITGRYAQAYLRRIRSALDDQLPATDLETLDRLISDDHRDALVHRNDLSVRSTRTAWAARRPA